MIIVKRVNEISSPVNKSGNERVILFYSATWWICLGETWGHDIKKGSTYIVMKSRSGGFYM